MIRKLSGRSYGSHLNEKLRSYEIQLKILEEEEARLLRLLEERDNKTMETGEKTTRKWTLDSEVPTRQQSTRTCIFAIVVAYVDYHASFLCEIKKKTRVIKIRFNLPSREHYGDQWTVFLRHIFYVFTYFSILIICLRDKMYFPLNCIDNSWIEHKGNHNREGSLEMWS